MSGMIMEMSMGNMIITEILGMMRKVEKNILYGMEKTIHLGMSI
jgi:hypothetical protein